MKLASDVEKVLSGLPGQILSGLLIGIAGIAVLAALFAPASIKLILAAWMVAP